MKFAEAVAYAKAIRKRAGGFWLDPGQTGPLGEKGLEAACAWHWRGIAGRRVQMRADLVALAGRNAKAQAWLRLRIATALEAGEPIPPVFMQWLVAFLRHPAPPKGKASPPVLSTRDEFLAFTVRALVAKGLKKSEAIEATGEAWALSPEAIAKAIRPKRKAPSPK